MKLKALGLIIILEILALIALVILIKVFGR